MFGLKKNSNKSESEKQESKRELMQRITSIIQGILFAAFGLELVCFYDNSKEIICYVTSVVLALVGRALMAVYFVRKIDREIFGNDLMMGLTAILAAGVVYIYRTDFLSIISMLIGLALIVNGFKKLQQSINMKRMDMKLNVTREAWLVVLIFALAVLVTGFVVSFTNVFSDEVMRILLGSGYIFAGVTDLIICIILFKKVKYYRNNKDAKEENETSAVELRPSDNNISSDEQAASDIDNAPVSNLASQEYVEEENSIDSNAILEGTEANDNSST